MLPPSPSRSSLPSPHRPVSPSVRRPLRGRLSVVLPGMSHTPPSPAASVLCWRRPSRGFPSPQSARGSCGPGSRLSAPILQPLLPTPEHSLPPRAVPSPGCPSAPPPPHISPSTPPAPPRSTEVLLVVPPRDVEALRSPLFSRPSLLQRPSPFAVSRLSLSTHSPPSQQTETRRKNDDQTSQEGPHLPGSSSASLPVWILSLRLLPHHTQQTDRLQKIGDF
mmetsp:Transcript_2733/g.5655  ORF Transcript_2733/g.5655 Transcript_2733/m.5655 type:complete len:221 (-) Transcript_2733:44-706(-)